MTIEVTVADQTLRLFDEAGALLKTYVISTSKFGLGTESGSNRTPLGQFRIASKIGHEASAGTIFKSREPISLWDATPTDHDHVLTRILWLDGLEDHNANTRERYIYIHGTNQESLLGTPASHGCVRMANHDVIDLFARVPEGTPVTILG
jgi:L,D-transpeptidase YbiS